MAPRPERQPRRRTYLRTATLAATVALALPTATCSDDEDAADNPTSTTSSADSTTTTLSAEEDVEAAYLAFAEMGARLLENPNPDDPEIAQRASGEARGDLVDGLTTLRASNQRYELGPSYGHEVLAVQPGDETATVEVCVVDDSRLVNATTGSVEREGTTTVRWMVTMIRQQDRSLVDQISEEEVAEGTVECD